MMGYYGYHGYMPYGSNFTLLGPILMILFWIIVVVLIVYLVRGEAGISHKLGGHTNETALDILKKRYAK